MKVRAIFTVYPRKLKTGTVHFEKSKRTFQSVYYQCYDQNGRRTNGRSTGQRTKTAAATYCMGLHKCGELVPMASIPTFAAYSVGWWDAKTCEYVAWKKLRKPLTQSTIDNKRQVMERHIIPYFGKMRLDQIDENSVECWLLKLSKEGYGADSINHFMFTLRAMMNDAVRRKIIKFNPLKNVEKVSGERAKKKILTPEEAYLLLPRQWETVWPTYYAYVASKLAAYTGMRIGEVMGLRGEFVHDTYIEVNGQWHKKYGFAKTKNGKERNIPITRMIREELEKLVQRNGTGYLFSENGGKEPMPQGTITYQFKKALEKIGIGDSNEKSIDVFIYQRM